MMAHRRSHLNSSRLIHLRFLGAPGVALARMPPGEAPYRELGEPFVLTVTLTVPEPMADQEEWCSINEAARRLGVTPTAIRNRVKRGTLEHRPNGNQGKLVRVPRTVLLTVPEPVPLTATPTVPEPLGGTVTPTNPDPYAGEIAALRELATERLERAERAESRADRMEREVERLRAELDRLHSRPWWYGLFGKK